MRHPGVLTSVVVAAALSVGAAHASRRQDATTQARPEVLVPLSGTWTEALEDGRQVLTIQGAGERKAPDAANAAALFGAQGGASLVKSLAAPGAFTLAAARDVRDFRGGQISVRFKLIAGATDRTAGIVFNLKPDGSYNYARYNTKDGNVAIWKFENGTRTVLEHGEVHEQLPMNTWQTLTVTIKGAGVSASTHGGKLFHRLWRRRLIEKAVTVNSLDLMRLVLRRIDVFPNESEQVLCVHDRAGIVAEPVAVIPGLQVFGDHEGLAGAVIGLNISERHLQAWIVLGILPAVHRAVCRICR